MGQAAGRCRRNECGDGGRVLVSGTVPAALWTALAIAALALAATGCGGSSSKPLDDGSVGPLDVAFPVDVVYPETPPGDARDPGGRDDATGVPDASDPGPDDGAADTSGSDADADTTETCAKPAGFNCPCADNGDCASGFCVATSTGKACTQSCTENCPAGWVCAQVATSPDVVFECIPAHPMICHPCRSSAECKGPFSGEGALCVSYGAEAGRFCGGGCQRDGDCPDGYACRDAEVLEGGTSLQCVLSSGECACTPMSIGKVTGCLRMNEDGTCRGERKCSAAGLSACDAALPVAETCNQADDNCDGRTDEDCDHDGIAQEVDNCPYQPNEFQEDLNGDGEGDACDADIDGDTVGNDGDCGPRDRTVCPGCPEVCDGKDNDCDSFTDEGLCDDGNVCTDDSCGESGLCVHAPNNASCDDGNACTLDTCDPITGCVHEGSIAACDDHNPCTDDACDEATGCSHAPRLNATCDDGNACTFADTCDGTGSCRGTDADCTSDPGTCGAKRTCNGTAACDVAYAGVEAACNDGEACTSGDHCDGAGGCVGTPVACTNDPGLCGVRRACNGTATCTVTWPGIDADCDDGDACTWGDNCDGAGGCVGTPVACKDDPGTCGLRRACNGTSSCQVYFPGAGTSCDDGNPCTWGDHCDAAGGCAGTPISCGNDPGPCGAIRTCDGTSTCAVTYPGAATSCNDGAACTYADHCDGAGGCTGTTLVCANDAGTCGARRACNGTATCEVTWPDSGTPCNDGSSCTKGDSCDGAGTCDGTWDCDDNNPCTFDFPFPIFICCIHDPQDAPCTDNDPLTIGDACVDGSCVSGPRCGDTVCSKARHETCATCPGDCGGCPDNETNCTDGWDDDGDGMIDCNDGDCATVAPCNGATCHSEVDVGCGSRVNNENTSGNDVVGVATSACSSWDLGGRVDRVYRFYADATRNVTFEVLDGGTSDFLIYVLDNVCNPTTACKQAVSDTSSSGTVDTTVTVVAGHTYYLVVERSWGSDSYDFGVTCN